MKSRILISIVMAAAVLECRSASAVGKEKAPWVDGCVERLNRARAELIKLDPMFKKSKVSLAANRVELRYAKDELVEEFEASIAAGKFKPKDWYDPGEADLMAQRFTATQFAGYFIRGSEKPDAVLQSFSRIVRAALEQCILLDEQSKSK